MSLKKPDGRQLVLSVPIAQDEVPAPDNVTRDRRALAWYLTLPHLRGGVASDNSNDQRLSFRYELQGCLGQASPGEHNTSK